MKFGVLRYSSALKKIPSFNVKCEKLLILTDFGKNTRFLLFRFNSDNFVFYPDFFLIRCLADLKIIYFKFDLNLLQ